VYSVRIVIFEHLKTQRYNDNFIYTIHLETVMYKLYKSTLSDCIASFTMCHHHYLSSRVFRNRGKRGC